MFALDPDDDAEDEKDRARIFASVKNNCGPKPPALRCRVVDLNGAACIEWMGVAEGVTADRLLERRAPAGESQTGAAIEWLREYLADGPKDHREIQLAGEMRSFTEKMLRTARERLKVEIDREGRGKEHRTLWRLPGGGES